MIGYYYICNSNGVCRIVDYHYDSQEDSEAVRAQHGRHPPVFNLDLQVAPDEIVIDVRPSIFQAGQPSAAFKPSMTQITQAFAAAVKP
jgi:hypothetical protein